MNITQNNTLAFIEKFDFLAKNPNVKSLQPN